MADMLHSTPPAPGNHPSPGPQLPRLEQLEAHDAEHADTVHCIRRMWDELDEAIDFLKYW